MRRKINLSLPFKLHPLWLLAILIFAIGLACSLPSQTQPETGTPVSEKEDSLAPPPSPTLPPPPTPTPQPLPPALVEVDPMPGSEIALQGEIVFYFNQSMDRGSVEGALVGQPQLSGHLSWVDDATLVFQPDTAFPPDTPINVDLGTTARAANGLALLEPVRLTYRTAAPMQAVQVLPEPDSLEVEPASAIITTFDQPVVPLGADPSTLPAAFSIAPAVSGQGEWINTSTYAYYPDPPMVGGMTYTVSLNRELHSTSGGALSGLKENPGMVSWSFSTALPHLLSISPQAEISFVPLDTTVELVFNQSMNASSVEQNFSLLSSNGAEVSGVFGWDENFSTLIFTPTQWLDRDSAYTVILLGAAQSQGGSVLATDTSQRFYTVTEFLVTGTDPIQDGFIHNYQGVSFYFSSPPDVENPLDYVQVSPEVANLSYWYGSESLNFNGSFEPNTPYVMTLSGDLKDRWGSTLGQDFTLRFRTDPLQPTLYIAHGESELFVTPQDSMLSAQAANLRSVELMIGSIPIDQLWRFLGPTSYDTIHSFQPLDAQRWIQPLDVSNSRLSTIQLPLTSGNNALPPGLYHYSLSARELDYPPGPFLIVSSNVHLTFKISPTQAFVWALDLRNNTPVVGAPVTIYDIDGNALASGATNRNGTFEASIPARPDIYGTFYAILGSPSDDTFSLAYSSWDSGLQGYEFSIPIDYLSPGTSVYIYTDRPIYRPGQVVNFRAIVRQTRNGRYTLSDLGILPIDITDGNYQPVLDLELPLSEYGTAHGQFTLAEDAPPGYYQINTPYGMVTFQVAEYRKPEIDLQVTAEPSPAMAGETIIARIDARYFFDAPAGDIPLTWSVTAAPEYFSLPGYSVGLDDYGWLLPFWLSGFNPYGDLVSSGEGRTDPEGLLTIEIPTISQESAKRYTVEVTLQDDSGFPVSNRAEVVVHPADFYAGVKPDSWVGQAGQELGFEVKTVDWEQNPAGNRELSARFQKITWIRGEKLNVFGYPDYIPQYTPVSNTDFRTGEDGLARLAFTPPDPGSYQLEVRGGGVLTQLTIWVGGAGQVTWPNLPNQHIEITTDQDSYMPGDHARVFIPNPLGENVQALITLERGEVLRHQTLNITSSGYSFDLPLTDEDAPNVYLAVTLVGRNSQAQFDFRQGYTNIKVEPLEQTLNVSLTPDPDRAGPRDEVAFTVQVTDADGNPVQGEFSLSVIDKAVLALADPFEPDIVQAFYGIQPLGVRTGLSLAAYAHRFTDTAGGMGGGGGEPVVPTVREEFPDTAYWNAEIITDANGEADITLQLPDSLTTWQATTRGVTLDSRVGEAKAELVSTKDLLVRPVTPRFLINGDHLRLTGIVQNNTARDLTVEVALQASGFSLDDPTADHQMIAVPGGGRVAVDWWGTVEAMDTVDLIFSARSGELSDATKPIWGDLPVFRYTAPQTFGTAGTMESGGERLEIVSLPRTFDPYGGDLSIELDPSLAAAMLPGLDVLEHYPYECTEQTISRFLPNLEAYRAVQALGLSAPDLEARLERTLNQGLQRLVARQNDDGGWGWWSSPSLAGNISDTYITTYVLFGLARAREAGAFVDEIVIQNAVDYLIATLPAPEMLSEPWQFDRLAFQYFVLAEAGSGNPAGVGMLYERRSQLSPWAQAFLALTLETLSPGDPRLRELYSDLEVNAIRSATGVHWEGHDSRMNMETPVFNSAVVIYALAQHDPASATIPEAVRYLIAARGADGAWASTYETAWSIMALTKVMQGTGELAGDFGFGAALNGVGLVEGAAGGDTRLNPVNASVPVSSLYADDPNALTIQRDDGPGRLYYTAYLNVLRPVEEVAALYRGISVERSYETVDGNPIAEGSDLRSSVGELIVVKVALTLKNAAYYLVVEDYIPAGAEILDTTLKSSQQTNVAYDPRNPFKQGWGWWYFNDPQIYDERIAWSVEYLPAGTYELTYTLILNQPGDYRVLPTRAWEFYFPEVQGNSAGAVFVIED